MKTKTQVKQKIRDLRKLLDRAEDNYTSAVGLSDESSWHKRIQQLETQIEMLNWVLKDKLEPARKALDPVIEEYGAECNPKRFGE